MIRTALGSHALAWHPFRASQRCLPHLTALLLHSGGIEADVREPGGSGGGAAVPEATHPACGHLHRAPVLRLPLLGN